MSPDAFEGLNRLVELDISFNPVIRSNLPAGLFDRTPSLRVLSISGYVIDDVSLSSVGRLDGLEEIAITPSFAHMPYFLARLPKLTSIFFHRCVGAQTLTASLLRPFTESRLEQLAFVDCHLSGIENSTFDNFTSLRVLNVVRNGHLRLTDVIDALSTSTGVTVSTLVADLTGYERMPIFLSLRDYPTCRPVWHNLSRLSMRGANIFGMGTHFFKCLKNLEALAAGFNPIMIYPKAVALDISLMNKLQFVDLSKTHNPQLGVLQVSSGFGKGSVWVKRNDDYFALPRMPPAALLDVKNPVLDLDFQENCTLFPVPIRLEYIFGELSLTPPNNKFKYACSVFTPNNIRYLNLSYMTNTLNNPMPFDMLVRGLSRLEVLDLSGNKLTSFNWKTCEYLPSLRVLKIADNMLSHSLPERFPRMNNLTDLCLSGNDITSLPKPIFADLVTLRRLLLADNRLNVLNFDIPDTLRHLDVSRNAILVIGDQIRNKLDVLSAVELHFRGNLLLCGCGEVDAVRWFQQTAVQIVDRHLTRCIQNEQLSLILDVDVSELKMTCNHVVISASVSVAAVVFITVVAVVCYGIRHHSSKLYSLLV